MEANHQPPTKRRLFDPTTSTSKSISKFNQKLFSLSPPTPPAESGPKKQKGQGWSSLVKDAEGRQLSRRAESEPLTDSVFKEWSNHDASDIVSLNRHNMHLPISNDVPDLTFNKRSSNTDDQEAPTPDSVRSPLSIPNSAYTPSDTSALDDAKDDVRDSFTPQNCSRERQRSSRSVHNPRKAKKTKPTTFDHEIREDARYRKKLPNVITLDYSRNYLAPKNSYGSVPRLTRSFTFRNCKFMPITIPYLERLDSLYCQRYFTSSVINDNIWDKPFLPGFPFPNVYPNSSTITSRHLKLAVAITTHQKRDLLNPLKIKMGPDQQQQTQKPRGSERPPRREAMIEPEVIKSNMQSLVDEPPVPTDRDFAALHYQRGQCDKVGQTSSINLQILETKQKDGLSTPKSEIHRLSHSQSQFYTQRAESAAYAERQGENSPVGTFSHTDFDDMGNKNITEKTRTELNAEYHALLSQAFQSFDDAFALSLLEQEHGPSCQFCQKYKPPFAPDPLNRSWTLHNGVPEDGLFTDNGNGWDIAELVDLGDEDERHLGIQDLDQLMDGY